LPYLDEPWKTYADLATIPKKPKNQAKLIEKIYEVDPLACPKCQGPMRVISFIEDQHVIEKILTHLCLWEVEPGPPPRMPRSHLLYTEPYIDYSDSQVPSSDNGFYVDPEYPADLSV